MRRFESVLIALAGLTACRHAPTPDGACERLDGMWLGDQVRADDPNADREAIRVIYQAVHEEQWRLSHLSATQMYRERVGMEGGQPVVHPLAVREDSTRQCVVEVTGPHGGQRMVFTPRADGTMASHTDGSWFTAIYRRP